MKNFYNEDTNINEIKIKKPGAFLYYFIGIITNLLARILFKMRIDKKEIRKIKGPVVVIANHASVVDIVFTVGGLMPKRLNILASRDLFTWNLFKPFIYKLGCIPKSQFAIDVMSLKMMKAAIEQGRNVALYPEGKTSIDGKGLHYITPSIGKLIKFLGVPVIISYTEGGYLTKPRYFKGFRYGKVRIKESLLLSQEDINTKSKKEIYDIVTNALKFNDNIYQQENNIRFRSKRPALGMDYILYKCPKCGEEYKMRSTDRHLICDACGNNVEYTEYGRFIPQGDSKTFERIDLWYDWQRKCVDEEIRKDDFYIEKPVVFYNEVNNAYEKSGEGVLYINKEYIGYKGTKYGEETEIKSLLKRMHTITTKNEEGIDLAFPDGIYRFLFENDKCASKYGIIVEQMFKMTQEKEEE